MDRPIARHDALVIQEIPGETLVYDLNIHKAHCLNESAAFVWKHCDGNNSVADIVKLFETEGKGTVTADFVWLALDQLSEKELLRNHHTRHYAGKSRRELIKTLGLATSAALPLVASLIAPPNAMATISPCVCTSPAHCHIPPCNTGYCDTTGLCSPFVPSRRN